MKKIALLGLLATAGSAFGQMRITEWMYNGLTSEYIEFTNVGSSAVDMNGYSFDDDSRTAFTFDLSGFGMVAAGESVILSEATAADFRTGWSLAASVKVVGENSANLGRTDEINLFDVGGNLVDRLTYSDQNIPGSIRTQNVSGNTTPENYGTNNVLAWVLAVNGDSFGSWTSAAGDIGNPGQAPVPEPATLGALAIAALGLIRKRRA